MYRIELDALNALVEEQRRTNELLSDIKELLTVKQPHEAERPKRNTRQRRTQDGSDK